MLQVKNISVTVDGKQVINDFSLEINPGELHVLMGPNGSGKSSLSLSLSGHPRYEIKDQRSKIKVDGDDITDLKPEERAKAGLFLAFQNPVAVPGVKVTNFLRLAYNEKVKSQRSKVNSEPRTVNGELDPLEFYQLLRQKASLLDIPEDFLGRSLNDQFSGGEKKRMEMLQALVLEPKYAFLDEPDTGTDIDALKVIARAIQILQKKGTGVLLITHYQRILKYLRPDRVHVLKNGKIVVSGNRNLIAKIEKSGYTTL